MNVRLPQLNLVGVVALAVLCGVQWHHDRQLNVALRHAQKRSIEIEARLEEQTRALTGCQADRDELRQHLARLTTEQAESARQGVAGERELREARAAQAQLEAAMVEWRQALTERDAKLEEASKRLRTVAEERDQVVTRFNALAARFNEQVREREATGATPVPSPNGP